MITTKDFSKDDGDDVNENVKKVIGLITKTTTLHVHYTSLSSLHVLDVKFPDGTFFGERKHTTTNFFLSF